MGCQECEYFKVKVSGKKVSYWVCKKTGMANISGRIFEAVPEYCPIPEGGLDE